MMTHEVDSQEKEKIKELDFSVSANIFPSLLLLSMITSHGLHIARSAFQVPLKGLGNVEYLDDMVHPKLLLLVHCESLGCAYCILDLLQHVSLTIRASFGQGRHTCRPLRLRLASLSKSSFEKSSTSTPPPIALTLLMNVLQTLFLALLSSSP